MSATPTLWPSHLKLSNQLKSTCTQFKLLQGSNRINELKKIEQTILNNAELQVYKNDIGKILGMPDNINEDGNWIYILNPNLFNSKVIFSYNNLTHKLQQSIIN